MKSWRQPYGVQDEAGDALLAVYTSSSMPQDGYLPAGRIFQAVPCDTSHKKWKKSHHKSIDTSIRIDTTTPRAPDRSLISIRIATRDNTRVPIDRDTRVDTTFGAIRTVDTDRIYSHTAISRYLQPALSFRTVDRLLHTTVHRIPDTGCS